MHAEAQNNVCLVTQACLTLATPWTAARQAPLSMGFSRQEYWSGGPFPSPGIFLTQGSNPQLLHWQADSSPLSHLGRSPKSELWLSKWTHSFWHFWHIRRTNQTKRHSMTKTQEHVPTNILCDDWSWNGASKWNYVKSMIAIPNNSWFWESTK